MAEHLNEVVLQSFIAALVVEALLRLWDVQDPAQRLACRFGALAGPVLLFPFFEGLAPFRHADWFANGPALIATRHFAALTVGSVGVDRLVAWPAWALGALLLGRDLWPLLFSRTVHPERSRGMELRSVGAEPSTPLGLTGAGPANPLGVNGLRALVGELSATAGVAPPRVDVVEAPGPLLLCTGVRRSRLLVSPALFELLDEGELRGAVAHELSHVRRHDVLGSWVLLALRVLQAFNPVAQVLGRTVAWETELRADADAARWTGRPAALASALLKVFGTPDLAPLAGLALSAQLQRARASALETRCRLLLDPPAASKGPGPVLFTTAALGLAVLLFFVT